MKRARPKRSRGGPFARLLDQLDHQSSRPWLALFLFALLLRLIYLYQIAGSPFAEILVGDAQGYDAWAQQIGHDFWGHDAFFQAPLYPYFLATVYAVLGHTLLGVRVIQAVLGAASCVLLARAVGSLFSRRSGFLSGALLAVYGPALFFDGLVQKASLDLFLTSALLACLVMSTERDSRRFPALAGALLGCLALTRENSLIWVPCLMAWLLLQRPAGSTLLQAARGRLAPFVAGLLVVLLPVTARNYAVSGEAILTTSQFGQNFFIGNNPDADGTYQSLRFGHGGAQAEREDARDIAERASGRKLSAAQVSHYWSTRAFQFIRQNPGKWLELQGRKWLLVWNAHELPDSDEVSVYEDESWLLGAANAIFSFGALAALAAAGALLALRTWRATWLLHLLVSSLAASTSLFFLCARYRYPLVPLLVPFAVLAVTEIANHVQNRRVRPALGLLAVVCGAWLVVHLDLVPGEHPRATAFYDLGVSLERLERAPAAESAYRSALSAHPDFVEAHINLGALLARAGKLEEAATHEQAALSLKPDDALAHADLGNVLFEQNRLPEATGHYEEALRIDPNQPQARAGLEAIRAATR